jgi:hypothetical protein
VSVTTSEFDPYQQWLGIAPHERPADHYRLLGLARFETDVQRIARAADERMALVRSYQTGPRGSHTQRILNEISAARVCLLEHATKAAYDSALHQMLAQAAARQTAVPPAPTIAPPVVPPPFAAPYERRLPERTPAPPLARAKGRVWWRPLEMIIAVAVLALAGTIGWGVLKDRFQASPERPSESEMVEPEPAEEPPLSAVPVVLLQEGSGEVNLSPATATLSGNPKLRTVGGDQLLTGWTSPEDTARWRFRLIIPGAYRVVFTYAAAESALGAGLNVTLDEDQAGCDLRPTGALDRFDAASLSVLIPESGEHTLSIKPKHKSDQDWLHLKGVQLVPVNPPKAPETVRPPTAAQNDS